jgi:hypothetical protein
VKKYWMEQSVGGCLNKMEPGLLLRLTFRRIFRGAATPNPKYLIKRQWPIVPAAVLAILCVDLPETTEGLGENQINGSMKSQPQMQS